MSAMGQKRSSRFGLAGLTRIKFCLVELLIWAGVSPGKQKSPRNLFHQILIVIPCKPYLIRQIDILFLWPDFINTEPMSKFFIDDLSYVIWRVGIAQSGEYCPHLGRIFIRVIRNLVMTHKCNSDWVELEEDLFNFPEKLFELSY